MDDTSADQCRLCLSQKELVSVFNCDNVKAKKMEELILLTTGVEILEKDVISRKICTNCSKVVIKMHEFRERSIRTDKFLKEKCIEQLRATEMKIPNTNVTITTRKRLKKEKLGDSNHNNHNNCKNKLDESKDENNSYSHNSSIPRKVSVHKSVSELFSRHPNIKLRTDVLVFDFDPFVSLELDEVEKYCNANNIDLKLATKRALQVNTARKRTRPLHNKKISNSNSSSETNISEDKIISPNNLQSDKDQLKVSPISIKLVDDRYNFKVTPVSIKRTDDNVKFTVISKDTSERKRENSDSEETITAKKESKIKRRRLSSNDFTSDTEQTNPTLFETLELKPSQPSPKQTKTYKCNICLSVHKNAKTLKLHYQEHFCCSFCKARFRLIERRISHEQKCTVGHALNSKPYVELTRVDLDSKVKNKYLNCNSVINKNSTNCNEVIVLSDDDEPVIKSTSVSNSFTSKSNSDLSVGITDAQNIQSKVNMSVTSVANEFSRIDKLINECEMELNKVTTHSSAKSNTCPQSPATVGNNEILPQIEVSSSPNVDVLPVQYSSTAIVRPDIRIKNDTLLNTNNLNSSDIPLLQELLRHAKRLNKSLKKPTTEDITRNGTMKNMFLQLRVYKVPINIRHGEHCVTISEPEPDVNKEVTMWNDITPLPLINKKTNMDITNITLKPSQTVPINTVNTNNPATLQHSVSVPIILNGTVSRINPTLANMLTPNTQYSKTNSSYPNHTIVSSPNIPSQSSLTVTSPNGVRTVFSQRFTPNFLITSNALNSTNNTSPVNSNASSPQLVPRNLNSAIVNNATNNSRLEFVPLPSTAINLTNNISQFFRPPGGVVMTNSRSVLRPASNPVVTDRNIITNNRLSTSPTQNNGQFAYSNSNNRQITAPMLNNQCVVLNATVANASTTPNAITSNNIQQNILNTTTLMPNNNTNNNYSTSSPCETSVAPNNFTFSKPIIRVKNICELK
ncbi:unnamed protein product [Diabrotica balteata]|uniref:ZAD domain-containing protein n=1 Tax=Diabrotica balteata TaxID=107213 RepID=A0A9N9T947_DIABA|nr:unnamed protein product [Diabrotica balteata]